MLWTSKLHAMSLCNLCLLKTCAAEHGDPLQRVFNTSLQLGRVPTLWKTSCIVPVPKKNLPSELNDFRPVALTSHLMKMLESSTSSGPRHSTLRTACSLPTEQRLVWRMPSSTSYTETTCIWTRETAQSGSSSWTFRVPSTQSSLFYSGKN